jgi:hypothetical protein
MAICKTWKPGDPIPEDLPEFAFTPEEEAEDARLIKGPIAKVRVARRFLDR